jgi:glycosyltransferase involved in cell wall biosynthesis
MKVLHVYRDLLSEGGIPYQTRCLAKSQARLGYEVLTVSLDGSLREEFSNQNPKIKTIIVPSELHSLSDLRDAIGKYKPDIAHFTGLWIPIQQLWALEVLRARIPYIVSTHGNLNPYGMNVRFGDKRQIRFRIWAKRLWHRCVNLPYLRHAAGIHAHSEYEKELLTAAGLSKLFIAPNGIDPEWVRIQDGKRRKLHRPVSFLHLGRLDIYHKGLDLVCEALQGLRESGHHGIKVIFVGPTVRNSRQMLERLAAQFGKGILEIRDAVWGKDKELLWSEADYFLNLYRFGGLAIAPSEALAKGIPLIASREGNFGDWTTRGKFGFETPLNGQSLQETFVRILKATEQEYHCLSERAMAFAKTYSWDRTAKEIIQGYHSVL